MDDTSTSAVANTANTTPRPLVAGLETQSTVVVQTATAPLPIKTSLKTFKPEQVISFLHSFDSAKDMCNKLEDGFIILREQLKWLVNEPTLDRAATKYFQDIRRVMSCEDFRKNKHHLKQGSNQVLPEAFLALIPPTT